MAEVLEAHRASQGFIEQETVQMLECRLAPTKNRSVVGIMNEFPHLVDACREPGSQPDLVDLSLRLAETPCGPLYKRHITPKGELAAVLAQFDR